MKISIITITYNNFDDLIKTIASFKGLSGKFQDKIEFIVINGGQCEKTNIFLKEEYDGVYLTEPDEGIADAFDKGWRLAKGDYICYINSGDTLIDADYFSFSLQALQDNNLDGTACEILLQKDSGNIRLKNKINLPNMPYNHPGLILKKELFYNVDGFRNKYKVAMDFDLLLRIKKQQRINVLIYKKIAIKMDGEGISSTKSHLGVLERYISLKDNQFLNLHYGLILFFQLFKSYTKNMLILLKLKKVVNLYERMHIKF